MFYLFVTQGILSAIGVLVARGHPLSALTAFSLAWFGFLHPFLAIGWLAGYVEAHLRPFTTADLKTVMKAETFGELMNNKLFRIILVAGMANLGSMIGTFVAIPIMVYYLGITNPLDILKMAFETGLRVLSGLL
jgi:pheromone shutdown protein TraB